MVKRKMRNGRGKDNEREERVIREDERAKEEVQKVKDEENRDGGGLAVQPRSGNTAPACMDTAKAWTHSVRTIAGALSARGVRGEVQWRASKKGCRSDVSQFIAGIEVTSSTRPATRVHPARSPPSGPTRRSNFACIGTKMSGGLFSLEGKQVFITGASSGLGEHFLRLCAREGATDLVVCARRSA